MLSRAMRMQHGRLLTIGSEWSVVQSVSTPFRSTHQEQQVAGAVDRAHRRPTLSLASPIGPTQPELEAVRQYRLCRLRGEMAKRGIAACILSDPVNIRYATDARNMQVFTARNGPSRYLLLTENEAILYEFPGCAHMAASLNTITEIRPAVTASFVAAGAGILTQERRWAQEMASTLRDLVGPAALIGIERMNAGATLALAAEGFSLVDAQEPVEMARSVKSQGEIACIRAALQATGSAVSRMRSALQPGMTENELWSLLHQGVIAQGGEYCETRLLSSGARTNPWFQETGPKRIGPNELVALDTDVVGCHGYYSDFSRTVS